MSSAAQRRRASVALLVLTSALACADSAPAGPDSTAADARHEPAATAALTAGLVSVVDDATSRLMAGVPADSPMGTAFTSLRTALRAGDRPAALAAVTDVELALDFSSAAQEMDAADRAALVLQLHALRAQLADESR